MILPNFPVGAEQRHAQLMAQVSLQARAWVLQEAGRFATRSGISEHAAMASVKARFPALGSNSGADIEAMAFTVLMEAAQSARNDLKSAMDVVKAINEAKERARHAKSPKQMNTGPIRHGTSSAFSGAIAPKHKPMLGRSLTSTAPMSKAQLDVQLNMARNDVDKLSEMGEMESLRLQMAMDRTSQMMSALSNILKKMSMTNSSIISNLK